jgi:hypothetical protein
MRSATEQKAASSSLQAQAERRVKDEIQSILQVNGNTRTAKEWVPRVVMMAYERRCANDPNNGELAECFSVAQAIAGRS